ncbi:hypothetical protein NWF34_06025 [Gordonia sp. GONU]|uniref:hypothetical protein n=1 Tax=Gordonia sp. GONU TaxID=2972949 RepID=UPI0021AD0EB6|nr:hypothetical protein [Gordonia sp. GONU]MCR8896514.1 hypothetical protein [Gordonia sp. GONU]
MTIDHQSRAERADYLTNLHFSLVALLAEGRRDDAAALLRTLRADDQADMWARSLFDTLFMATALAAHLGVDDVPAWLRSYGTAEDV